MQAVTTVTVLHVLMYLLQATLLIKAVVTSAITMQTIITASILKEAVTK